jgi:CheY-like chemotaxis protein
MQGSQMIADAKRLLVVDDNPAMRESLGELLRHQGYDVLTAADGAQGLQAVHDESPDLVILDVAMPGLDGFHVAALIKKDPSVNRIPIVLYTGHFDESIALQAHETQAEYFLAKTANIRPILTAIRDLLETTPAGCQAA